MNILITGSTGFLGNGLLHYLSFKDNKNTHYLLIRDKKNMSAIKRFNLLKTNFPKLHLEILEVNLLDIDNLTLDIDCIINCAASIEFNLPLQDALQQNVDGLKKLIYFANKNKVKRFIHISTAYVSSPFETKIKEEFVDLNILGDINILYSKIKQNNIGFDEIVKKKYFPNTYTFTKCLAEKIIEVEMQNNTDIIYTIIRPSIITSAINIPYCGWFQSYGAALGLFSLVHLNYLPFLICDQNNKFNIVPIDYVCHIIYASLLDEKNLIKHVTSFFELIHLNQQQVFLNTIYNISFATSIINGINIMNIMNNISLFKIRLQIWLCFILCLINNKYDKIYKKLNLLYVIVKNANKEFYYFVSNIYHFENDNSREDTLSFILPKYCDTKEKYFVSINNSIRYSLNIHDNCLTYSFIEIIYNIWTKYTSSLNLVYLSIISCITKIFLTTIFKQITIEYTCANTVRNIFYSHKPIVILSNHQSHLDTLILKYIFLIHPNIKIENPSVISTDEFKNIPTFLKYLLDLTNIKYISKTNFNKSEFETYLQKDFYGNMILFPEGSRSRDRKIHPFKSGIYNLINQNIDFNVLPITISYSKVPETNLFIKSLLYNNSISFYDTMYFLYYIISQLFSTAKDNCHIIIDELIKPPKQIKDTEQIINTNHHYLLNKYHKSMNINDETNDLTYYYFNNIQYSKYDTENEFTEFQKYIIGSNDNVINNINHIHKITINYKKLFFPLYTDFITIYYKINKPLLLGEYSKNIYEEIIINDKLQLFLNDLNNIINTNENYNLIIGITGLIGSNFFEYIISNENIKTTTKKYIVLSRNIEKNNIIKYNSYEFHLIKGDITNLESIEDFDCKLNNVSHIYFFGGMVSHCKDSKKISQMWETNVTGTKNICSIAEINKKINNKCLFVYLSTSGVVSCQDIPIEKIDENIEYSENTKLFPYYNSKIEAEKYIISHAKEHNYQLLIFRPSMIFGKQKVEILKNILNMNCINIKNDLFYKIENKKMFFCTDTYVNVIHIEELIDIINNAIEKIQNQPINKNIEIYNLSGNNYKLEEIYNYYNNDNYIFVNKLMINSFIYITNKINIYPSLYYYLRMCLYNWKTNYEKAKNELGFFPKNIFYKNNNFIKIPIFGKIYYE